ncbi:MAG: PEGA domain-containing protein [Blastocatellia bacterium]
MQCPRCQTEVSDWQYYCPNCRAQVQNYTPEFERPQRGKFERVGARVLSALLAIFIVGGLVLMARVVQWKQLFDSIRGNADASTETSPGSKNDRSSRTRASTSRPDDGSPTPTRAEDSAGAQKSQVVESVRALSQKIEELPSADDQPQAPKPKPPTKAEETPTAAIPESASTPKSAAQPTRDGVQLGVEQIDAKSNGETGFVAINSYTPARIYVNGQFSGITPRTIRLTAGDHQIRLMADGHEDWTRRVRLKAQQQVGIMASMRKKSPQKD